MICRPRRSDIEILAGTVACPQCAGKGQYQRHTPNFARFFGLQEPWQDEVGSTLTSHPNVARTRTHYGPQSQQEAAALLLT